MKQEELTDKGNKRKTPRSPRLRLEITQHLIDSATAKDSNHCMIADAVKASYPTARGVSVDLATIRFTDRVKGLRYTYLTPRIAQAALVNFDQKRKPDPFSFLLRGAQVTKSAKRRSGKPGTPAQQAAALKGRLVARHKGGGYVSERVGGQTPPLQRSPDNVPFSRRRAYGLRALEL